MNQLTVVIEGRIPAEFAILFTCIGYQNEFCKGDKLEALYSDYNFISDSEIWKDYNFGKGGSHIWVAEKFTNKRVLLITIN